MSLHLCQCGSEACREPLRKREFTLEDLQCIALAQSRSVSDLVPFFLRDGCKFTRSGASNNFKSIQVNCGVTLPGSEQAKKLRDELRKLFKTWAEEFLQRIKNGGEHYKEILVSWEALQRLCPLCSDAERINKLASGKFHRHHFHPDIFKIQKNGKIKYLKQKFLKTPMQILVRVDLEITAAALIRQQDQIQCRYYPPTTFEKKTCYVMQMICVSMSTTFFWLKSTGSLYFCC
eukprot:m.251540 g.251540  ORF g.251540 m.251540 type:complete len:233 (+) comp16149_c0_seq12:192-890(+)